MRHLDQPGLVGENFSLLRFDHPSLRHGHDREPHQIEDWLTVHCDEFLAAHGLPWGWWCGINLPREQVFGDMPGDIDIIAGPVGLTITPAELAALVAEEDRRWPNAPTNHNLNAALRRACREGYVEWPPRVAFTAAVEAKASYFERGEWHATHAGERGQVAGSLRTRQRFGVNVASLLHLGVVEPTDTAEELDQRVDAARATFPFHCGAFLDGFGYMTGVMGGMARHGTMTWGRISGPGWMQQPSLLNPLQPQPWHADLRARLGAMPPPPFFRTFIHACRACGPWRHSQSPNPDDQPCACSLGSRSPARRPSGTALPTARQPS